MSDPLEGAKLKIERSNRHIQELQTILETFLACRPYKEITDIDRVNGKVIIKLRATQKPPVEASIILGEILYLLKSALDHTVTTVAIKHGFRIKGTGFPVEKTRKELERSGLYRQIKQRLPELAVILDELKPYKSGCDLLWWLHILNAMEKHKTIMQVVAAMVGAKFDFIQTAGGREFRIPDKWQPISENEDAILFVAPIDANLKGQIDIALSVIFKDIDSESPHVIIDTTQQFIDLTAGIINIIENKCFP